MSALLDIVKQLESCGFRCEAGPLELNVAFIELKQIAEREPVLQAALEEIAKDAPPDDWKPYDSWGDYQGYPGLVDEVDESNGGDIHSHGCAVGRWKAAKIARKALRTIG